MAALRKLRSSFEIIEKDLETFLCSNEEHGQRVLSILQKTFDYSKKEESVSGRIVEGCPLEKLETAQTAWDLDHEQLWQQIQLQNESYLTKSSLTLPKLLKKEAGVRLSDDKLVEENFENTEFDEAVCEDEDDEDVDVRVESVDCGSSASDKDDDECLRDDHKRKRKVKSGNKLKGSVVDDQFFKLAEMEMFLEMEEKRAEANREDNHNNHNDDEDDSDDIDLFTDHNYGYEEEEQDDDSQGSLSKLTNRNTDVTKKGPGSYMYGDFFNETDETGTTDTDEGDINENDRTFSSTNKNSGKDKKGDGNKHFVESDNSEAKMEPDVSTNKSTFQKQQDKVKRKIAQLEDSNVSTKPWQLVGEASASIRPMNSLLEEILDFDHTTAAAPVITEETSQLLEDIIKQRIKDQTWDDVERKEKPVKEPYEYKKAQPLNQEKSKMSLSEIYEKEYLKQKEPADKKENKEHAEIQKMMKSLFSKLDALSNFHFTPKPAKSEITIVANIPSIVVEETAPVNVSETTLLAPEEVFDKPKAELKGASELTKTDRQHKRRVTKKRKKLQSTNNKEKEMKRGLGNKYSKGIVAKKLKKEKKDTEGNENKKSLSSSSAFFAKLQDNVRDEIQEKNNTTKKKNIARILSTQVKL